MVCAFLFGGKQLQPPMLTDLSLLQAFVAVGEDLSFTKAARRVGLTQSALSRKVRALEDEMGVKLLVRDTGGVFLSAPGQQLLADAQKLLAQAALFEKSARQAAQCCEERLDVGYLAAQLDGFLARALERFRQVHAGIRVHLHELSPSDMTERLREGQLDIAMLGFVCAKLEGEFDFFRIREDGFCVALPRQHMLAADEAVELGALADESLVIVGEKAFPGRKALIHELCLSAGFQPKVSVETDGVSSALGQVAAGQGISILPDGATRLAPESVVVRPLRLGEELPSLEVQAAVRKHEARQHVRLFLEECRRAAS